MLRKRIHVKGYTTPREFSGFQIPIALQSAAIRRYCDDHGLVFNHHVAENISRGTFLVLERIVVNAHLFHALAMCSVSMLPNASERRVMLLERCVSAGMTVHFLFESLVVSRHEDITIVEELVALTGLLNIDSDFSRISNIQEFVNLR